MCVASCSSLSLPVSLVLGSALTLQSAIPACTSPPTPSPSSSVIAYSPSSNRSTLVLHDFLPPLHFVPGFARSFVTLDPLTVLAS